MELTVKKLTKTKVPAMSYLEILIALVIIGILVLLAIPNFMPLISKAKSTEAQMQLEHLYTLEKTYFYQYSKYSTNFEDIGYIQEKLSTEGGAANYKITITEATEKGFTATATAVVDFNGDGKFNMWEVNQDKNLKETTKD